MDLPKRRTFKGGISGEEGRRKREDARLSMRRQERMDQLHKRRTGIAKRELVDARNSCGLDEEQKIDISKRLPEILVGINSTNSELQCEKVMEIRKMLSISTNPPIQQIIDSGIVPKLIFFLVSNENPRIRFESAWALTNIVSGTTEQTRVVINNGAIPIFMALLANPLDDIREQVMWALGNIAGDSSECRDIVLRCGILEPLIELCKKHSKITLLRNATWTLSNLCRGRPQVPLDVIKPALSVLPSLLQVRDERILADACWAFSYISDDTGPQNERITAVIRSGAVPRLSFLLAHKSNNVKHPALRTIGNIVTGDELQTQVVVNNSTLPRLLVLLTNAKKILRKEACWTISNITAGSVVQIQAVMENSLFQPIIYLLQRGEFDVKSEAAWAIANATSGGSPEQIHCLVKLGCIAPLCDILSSNNTSLITVVIDALQNILKLGHSEKDKTRGKNMFAIKVEECGGFDALEHLQTKEDFQGDNDMYYKLAAIVTKYFRQAEDSNFQTPDTNTITNTFNFQVNETAQASVSEKVQYTGFSF